MDIIAENGPEKTAKKGFVKESIISVYKSWIFFFLLIFIFFVPVLFFVLMMFPPFWILGIPYLCWIWMDRITPYRGGRMNRSLQNLKIWKFSRDYFPIKLVKTCEIPADKNYLFCAFPHGILPYGTVFNFATSANDFQELFPGIKAHTITLNVNFNIPLFRDIILSQGVCAASEDSLKYILNGPPGSSCLLLVGGVQEALKSFPSKYNIVLSNRKGFIKVALKTGASLVPVFSFGETNAYRRNTGTWCTKFESKFYSTLGIPFAFINGRGFLQTIFGIFPHRSPITTVVGKPIHLPKIENPTKEDIEKFHSIFVKKLEELFNMYKEKYDREGINAVLNIE